MINRRCVLSGLDGRVTRNWKVKETKPRISLMKEKKAWQGLPIAGNPCPSAFHAGETSGDALERLKRPESLKLLQARPLEGSLFHLNAGPSQLKEPRARQDRSAPFFKASQSKEANRWRSARPAPNKNNTATSCTHRASSPGRRSL